MTIAIRAGLVVIAIVTLVLVRAQFVTPLDVPCETSLTWPGSAPHGAIWEQETVHFEHVPEGYATLVGWINAATAVPCSDESVVAPRIEIRTLRLIARNAAGDERVLAEIDPREREHFVGRLFPRVPEWFGETEGKSEVAIASVQAEALALELGHAPLRVYHAWTEPRITIDPADQHFIELEASITETARLQFGVDYWRDLRSDYAGWDATCSASANCEGWVSDWYGNTDGEFRTFRAPHFVVTGASAQLGSTPVPIVP
jgi:hypothetical protein